MSTSQQRVGSGQGADARLGMAVDAGIISQAQADQIAALAPWGPTGPAGASAPTAPARPRDQAAVSPATEVVGYLGAILAMAGVTTLVADEWSDPDLVGRIGAHRNFQGRGIGGVGKPAQ